MGSSFAIGDWLVEPDRNRLVRGDTHVKMDPKAMQVLVYLAQHSDELALKERIIETVWEDTFVTDEVLTTSGFGPVSSATSSLCRWMRRRPFTALG